MARKLDCSLAAYRRWETGGRAPSAKWMIRLLALCPDEETRGLFGLPSEPAESDHAPATGASPLTGKQRSEMREEAYTVIDLLFDRAPDAIVNDVVRRLREYGGKYGRARSDLK